MRYVILAAMVVLVVGCERELTWEDLAVRATSELCNCSRILTEVSAELDECENQKASDCAAPLDGVTINIEDEWTGHIIFDGWRGPFDIDDQENCYFRKREWVKDGKLEYSYFSIDCAAPIDGATGLIVGEGQ